MREITSSLMTFAVSHLTAGDSHKELHQLIRSTERTGHSVFKDMHIIKEAKQKTKQITNSYTSGKYRLNYTNELSPIVYLL